MEIVPPITIGLNRFYSLGSCKIGIILLIINKQLIIIIISCINIIIIFSLQNIFRNNKLSLQLFLYSNFKQTRLFIDTLMFSRISLG